MQIRRFCDLCPIFLTILLCVTCCEGSDDVPRFAEFNSSTKSIFLGENEAWIPSATTMITTLMVGKSFTIQTNSAAVYGGSIVPDFCHLQYKCSAEDSDYQNIVLWDRKGNNNQGNTKQFTIGKYCSSAREFELKKVNDSSYRFTLLKNNITYERALKHSVELRLHALVSNAVLESGSLFVFSIGSIMSKNSESITRGNHTFKKFILTDDAIDLLTGKYDTDINKLTKVKFLNDDFLNLIKNATSLMRSLISVSLTLTTSHFILSGYPVCTVNEHIRNPIIFTSNDWYTAQAHNPSQFGGHINLETGMLLVVNNINYRLSSLRFSFRACLLISLNTDMWKHYVVEEVMSFKAPSFNGLTPLMNEIYNCHFNHENAILGVTLLAGVSNPAIASPIVCLRNIAILSVIFKGKYCNNNLEGSVSTIECGNVSVPNSGKSIIIDGTVDHIRHTGTFKFSIGPYYAFIVVSVVSMPLYKTNIQDGSLPPETFAILDLNVPLNCSVFHSGINQVFMVVKFRKLEDDTWNDYTIENFAINRLHKAPGSIKVSTAHSDTNQSLFITLPQVTTRWTKLKFTISCMCSIPNDQATALLGVPQYQTSTTTEVRYIGQRLMLDSNGVCESKITDRILILVVFLLNKLIFLN